MNNRPMPDRHIITDLQSHAGIAMQYAMLLDIHPLADPDRRHIPRTTV